MNEQEQKEIFNYLEATIDFIPAPQYTNTISRYQKWFQTDNKYFCPVWKQRFPQWESFKIDLTIKSLINNIQQLINNINSINKPNINSCLINKYPDGNHFISPHRDSPESFGEEPTIIILSLGETRTLLFESVNTNEKISWNLEPGSIFIMHGESQKKYVHSLEKSSTPNIRYSLTFREFIL
jgi:hypothetical protein